MGTFLMGLFLIMRPAAAGPAAAGDSAYAAMRYDEAIAAYASALDGTPGDARLLWKMARAHIASGEISSGDEKEGHYRSAEGFARKAVQSDSTDSQAHAWLAAALGNIAMYEGSETKVKLANEIHGELAIALRRDSTNDVAWSILGSFYRALGNVSWIERQLANIFLDGLPDGGYEESEAALLQATRLAPGVIRHRFELAMLYSDWDKPELSREALLKCLDLPVQVASDRRTLSRVRALLESQ
jgi:tetratricopeptide (TPR) repeat protein